MDENFINGDFMDFDKTSMKILEKAAEIIGDKELDRCIRYAHKTDESIKMGYNIKDYILWLDFEHLKNIAAFLESVLENSGFEYGLDAFIEFAQNINKGIESLERESFEWKLKKEEVQ